MPSWSQVQGSRSDTAPLLALVIPGSRPTPVTQADTCRTSLLQPQALSLHLDHAEPHYLGSSLLIQTYSHGYMLQACSFLPQLQPGPYGHRTQPEHNGPRHQMVHEGGPQHHARSQRFRLQDSRWMSQLIQRKYTFPPPLTFLNYLILLLCSIQAFNRLDDAHPQG